MLECFLICQLLMLLFSAVLLLFRIALIENSGFSTVSALRAVFWLFCSFWESSGWCFSLKPCLNLVEDSTTTLSR